MGALAVGRLNPAELDAVTIDAHGTLVTLVDPVPELTAALAARGVERERATVLAGFHAEVAHYREHSSAGRDAKGLAALQRDCARVFLDAIGVALDADEFAPVYAAAMRFALLPRTVPALERLRSLGLELAVVANWDLTLGRLLDEIGLAHYFRTVVHAAAKPAPHGLLHALAEVDVAPARALHIGDDEVDELAARAAGMRFAHGPLAEAVERLR
jgi:HAD superfamily hydrolase (TIGR01509 family)